MKSSTRLAVAAIVALAAAFYGVFILRTAFVVDGETYYSLFDDAMISMTYARNLAEGHGLLWNPGERPVEGYTNFLWTLWMALLHLLPIAQAKVSLAVMATSAFLLLANVGVVARIADRLSAGSTFVVATACGLTAFYYPLVYWSLRGMEVGLLTLLVNLALLGAIASMDRWRPGSLLLVSASLALALLTRPDALVPYLVIASFMLVGVAASSRLVTALGLGLGLVVPVAGLTAFRLAYYGDLLPNTYYLKVTGVSLAMRLDQGLRALALLVPRDLFPAAIPPLLALSLRRTGAVSLPVLMIAALIVAQLAYSVYVGGDAWEWFGHANRYVSTVMPAMFVLSALALHRLMADGKTPKLERFPFFAALVPPMWLAYTLASGYWGWKGSLAWGQLSLAGPSFLAALFGVILVLALIVGALLRLSLAWLFARMRQPASLATSAALGAMLVATSCSGYHGWFKANAMHVAEDQDMARLGLHLNRNTPPETRVAVVWAGACPYFARRPSVDLLGKSDPVIARGPSRVGFFMPGHTKYDYDYSLGHHRPAVVAQTWWAMEANAFLKAHYQRLPNGLYVRRERADLLAGPLGAAWKPGTR